MISQADNCVKKLQRAIAEYRGIAFERIVGPAIQEGVPDNVRGFDTGASGSNEAARSSGPPLETKRKYRRHPKPDENAPDRPPSAYVIFSNKIREEVKDQNLSFTQIAKLVGDRWQKLDSAGKEPFETQASTVKERYNNQLSAYRKTDEFKDYMAYLTDFRAKHGQTAEAKRPKLEPESSGSIISTKSFEASQEGTGLQPAHHRGGSMGSSASSPFVSGSTPQPTSSSGSVPQRPQIPSSRSGTPPSVEQSREYLRTGLRSGQGSASEDSAMVRSDVPDAVVRTAGLPLGAASATPPLQHLSVDSPLLPDPLARSRLSYFVQQQHTTPQPNVGVGQPGLGTLLYQSTLPTPTAQEPSWRNRPHDFRYQETSRPLPSSFPLPSPGREQLSSTQLPPILPQDRPPDFHQAQSPQILPPPQTPTGVHTNLLHRGRAVETPRRPTPEPLQPRQQSRQRGRGDIRSALNRSESDAANALAGLASGLARSDTTKPRGQQQSPRPPWRMS